MLDTPFNSNTYNRLLLRLFLDPEMSSYPKKLNEELGEGSSAEHIELKYSTVSSILENESRRNMLLHRDENQYQLFPDMRSTLTKLAVIYQSIKSVIARMGELKQSCLPGNYTARFDNRINDFVLVGEVRI